MAVGVYAEKGEYDSLFLSNYLDVYVKDALKRVPGVGDVIIFGERKYSMRLWLDPDRLAARPDHRQRRRQRAARAERPGRGRQRRPGAGARSARCTSSACAPSAGCASAAEFDDIIVKSGAGGSLVRLKDVGRAELGAETYASQLRFQGIEAVGFGVIQLPTANALDVERRSSRRDGAAVGAVPAGPEVPDRVQHHRRRRASRSARC